MQQLGNQLGMQCKAHCRCLVLWGLGLAALGGFSLLKQSRPAVDWWLKYCSMPIKRGISALCDVVPFSVCEAAATAAILLLLVRLVQCLVRALRHRPAHFGTWLLHGGCTALWVYVMVCLLWGTQYYGTDFAAKAGMADAPVATQDLAEVTTYFAAMANRTAGDIPRDAEGNVIASRSEILARSNGIYTATAQQWPFLEGPQRRAKPAVYSKLMSAWGYTGYLCPLFGESTVNVDSPAVFLPVTVAHEFAHQRGVAAEQEANFVGIQAAVSCQDPWYGYSGWLFGYLHLGNALYEADPEAWAAVWASLDELPKQDLGQNNAYWAGWEGPVNDAGTTVYEAFLQSYGQPDGLKSYGACVNLLVEYWKDKMPETQMQPQQGNAS